MPWPSLISSLQIAGTILPGLLGKTVEEVKVHYQMLVEDVQQIEAGEIPLPNYTRRAGASNKSYHCIDDQAQRLKNLNLN
ncbi:MYB FAMILY TRANSCRIPTION FACTOR-RELATED [Salix purpurea]|uniref:MYB FAMILY TRANSCRIPTION FACTOR-RELATED n=1 Tax=Salix purpurea TaxID=77065 RepID=A0A9Q0SRY9_SALPP|nr:MYB FAMILY TRANSCRIPTION FACTOR-RELATED [Salix purpurea]